MRQSVLTLSKFSVFTFISFKTITDAHKLIKKTRQNTLFGFCYVAKEWRMEWRKKNKQKHVDGLQTDNKKVCSGKKHGLK